MRKLRLLPILFLLLIMACQKADEGVIGASGSLYRRWHLFQSRKAQDSAWVINTDTGSDVEFRLDGTLIYRRDGVITSTPCCASGRFERSETTIRFLDANGCPNALCLSPGENSDGKSSITVLTDKLLEIKSGNWISQSTPVD